MLTKLHSSCKYLVIQSFREAEGVSLHRIRKSPPFNLFVKHFTSNLPKVQGMLQVPPSTCVRLCRDQIRPGSWQKTRIAICVVVS